MTADDHDDLYEAWMLWQNATVNHQHMIAAALFDIAESLREIRRNTTS